MVAEQAIALYPHPILFAVGDTVAALAKWKNINGRFLSACDRASSILIAAMVNASSFPQTQTAPILGHVPSSATDAGPIVSISL